MARPIKRRRICGRPVCTSFSPAGREHPVSIRLTLDEFEAIRLIDHEGLDQLACAQQMNVARTTVQAIYGAARSKIATALVNGLTLEIDGGDDQYEELPCCARCRQAGVSNEQRSVHMRIAVTYQNGEIFQHFGHTAQFKIYDVAEGKVAAGVVLSTGGSGHGALAAFLKDRHVDTLICGGIGGGAQQALSQAGIKLYAGVSGQADQAVEALLQGKLQYVANATCDHHGHDHGHDCGSHGCGEHGCGSSGCHH